MLLSKYNLPVLNVFNIAPFQASRKSASGREHAPTGGGGPMSVLDGFRQFGWWVIVSAVVFNFLGNLFEQNFPKLINNNQWKRERVLLLCLLIPFQVKQANSYNFQILCPTHLLHKKSRTRIIWQSPIFALMLYLD